MTLWLLVSQDKYELPLIVAESCNELADKLGITAQGLRNTINYYKNKNDHTGYCPYIKVMIEEDD